MKLLQLLKIEVLVLFQIPILAAREGETREGARYLVILADLETLIGLLFHFTEASGTDA